MLYDGRYKSRIFMRLILTAIPIVILLYFVDFTAKTYYNSSLEQILKGFLKSIGIA